MHLCASEPINSLREHGSRPLKRTNRLHRLRVHGEPICSERFIGLRGEAMVIAEGWGRLRPTQDGARLGALLLVYNDNSPYFLHTMLHRAVRLEMGNGAV